MKTIETLIKNEAKVNVGRYNLLKDKTAKVAHHNICKAILGYADEHNAPFGILLYVGVGSDAHKPSAFGRGYKKFDEKRADLVFDLCKAFVKYFGLKGRSAYNDKLVHSVCRFVDICKKGGVKDKKKIAATFKECLETKPKDTEVKLSKFRTAKEFGVFLFGDKLSFNENGYIDVCKAEAAK